MNTINMKQARKRYRNAYSYMHERKDSDGNVIERFRAWHSQAPGFRAWAVCEFTGRVSPLGRPVGKLERVVL